MPEILSMTIREIKEITDIDSDIAGKMIDFMKIPYVKNYSGEGMPIKISILRLITRLGDFGIQNEARELLDRVKIQASYNYDYVEFLGFLQIVLNRCRICTIVDPVSDPKLFVDLFLESLNYDFSKLRDEYVAKIEKDKIFVDSWLQVTVSQFIIREIADCAYQYRCSKIIDYCNDNEIDFELQAKSKYKAIVSNLLPLERIEWGIEKISQIEHFSEPGTDEICNILTLQGAKSYDEIPEITDLLIKNLKNPKGKACICALSKFKLSKLQIIIQKNHCLGNIFSSEIGISLWEAIKESNGIDVDPYF